MDLPKKLFSTGGSLRVIGPLNFTDTLGLMFVYLKLTGQIDWSWWWVTAPFWVQIIILTIMEFVESTNDD